MYNLRWLVRLIREGVADMRPAVQRVFNRDPTDDRLALVYGPSPARIDGGDVSAAQTRWRLALLALAGCVVGVMIGQVAPEFPLLDNVNWSAVVLGAVHAFLIRRYLFSSNRAEQQDFPWLAASLTPSLAMVYASSLINWLLRAPDNDGPISVFNHVLVSLTHAVGVAAALIIAVATLCYSRHWTNAIIKLCVRLFVFTIMVWVTKLVILDIGILGPIIAGTMSAVTGITLPYWFGDLTDALSYAAVMNIIYLAVVAATWTVCRDHFAVLLKTGDVDVLEALQAMSRPPSKKKKSRSPRSETDPEPPP